jgi:RimJ/RimL family protein N-acetyltransferase
VEERLRVRPAVAGDADLLLDWVNDPEARAASLTPGLIERAGHVRWLEGILTSNRAGLWIGMAGDASAERPVGQVRVVVDERGDGEVSVSVAAEARGRGLGLPLLEAGIAAADAALPVATFVAHVRPENAASRRLFLRAGFTSTRTIVRHGIEVLEFRRAATDVRGAPPAP